MRVCSFTPQGMFQDYYLGVNGSCDMYEIDQSSYWCQPYGRTAGATYCARRPSGVVYESSALPNTPYADASQLLVSAWRGDGAWFNWYWETAQYDPNNQTIIFGRGGFQGAEGSNSGANWFVENVFEELDYPSEFFYNQTTKKLYFFYNGTSAPPSDISFVAATQLTLFSIMGTPGFNAENISFSGITFSTTAISVLEPHGIPSGGDWALERVGALVFENTVDCVIDSCLFTKLDGNAIMLNGYNDGTTIQNNEFSYIGNNAMAAWGYSNLWDGTAAQFPVNTKVLYNLCHEIGHYEKQSSCWFQAKSALTTLQGNIFFNMPRAAVNYNDGFGGGNEMSESLIFNTCRESTDHGPFNSW